MRGSAVPTTVWSRAARKMPTMTAPRIRIRCGCGSSTGARSTNAGVGWDMRWGSLGLGDGGVTVVATVRRDGPAGPLPPYGSCDPDTPNVAAGVRFAPIWRYLGHYPVDY